MSRTTNIPVETLAGAGVAHAVELDSPYTAGASEVRRQYSYRRSSNGVPVDLNPKANPSTAALGSILLGDGREKVTFEGVLGAGGMGIVYAGFHRVIRQPVVVKVIRPEYSNIPELVARFQREAELLAAVASPGVVKLLDCDVTTTGLPYMVLERLEGHDLGELLRTPHQLKTNEALSIIADAAQALAAIHDRGVVHRDIKPDNLFLHTNSNGVRQLKLLDFGVALSPTRKRLTPPGTTVGSIHYMSPEQLKESHTVTPASDIWSLGVVLFQLLSGELPFAANSDVEFSSLVLTKNALNLRSVAPGVTKELAQVVMRCLHKDPWKRYANGAELARALSKYLDDQRLSLPIPLVRPIVRDKDTRKSVQRLAPPARRWTKLHIAAAGVAAGVALGYFAPRGMRDEVSRATVAAFAVPLQLIKGN